MKSMKMESPTSNSSFSPQNGKLKVLMLHGYHQNGIVFQKKTGAFRKITKNFADFVYITAPHVISGSNTEATTDETQDAFAQEHPVNMWWSAAEPDYFTTSSYIGETESIEFIRDVFRKEGPFDGVIGFSQGGLLASILCAIQALDPEDPIKFDFAIIISAFPPSPVTYKELLQNAKDKMCPTLHICGAGDTLIPKERSLELASLFKDSIVFEHKGGHYIPVASDAKPVFSSFLTKFQDLKNKKQ